MERIKTFTRGEPSEFNHSEAKSPYLTFTLGPGELRQLTIKIWSPDEGSLLRSIDGSHQTNPCPQAFIILAFGLLNHGLPVNDGCDWELFEFHASMSDTDAVKSYVAKWNFGAPMDDDDCDEMDVQAWLESLTTAEGQEIGVFPAAGLSSIHRMDIEVHSSIIQDTLSNIPSHSKSHTPKTGTSPALQIASSSSFTTGQVDEDDNDLVPRGNCSQWADYLQGVSKWLSGRFFRTKSMSDINHAIRIAQKAVDLTGQEHPMWVDRLQNLGGALFLRYQLGGLMDDLNTAIRLGQETMDNLPMGTAHPADLYNLAKSLSLRFERNGSVGDLNHAIDLVSRAIEMPQEGPNRVEMLTDLGQWIGLRFRATGLESNLNRAIEVLEMAVSATPQDHPDRLGRLVQLAAWHGERFMHTGSTDNLNLAIKILRVEAEDGHDPDDPSRSLLFRNLGIWLSRSFERSGSIQELNEGIHAAEISICSPESPVRRAESLANLATWIGMRFDHIGSMEDLERAIELFSAVLDTEFLTNDAQVATANNLGIRLGTRFLRTNSMADLNRAIEVLSSAADKTPHGHPGRATVMNNLGKWYGERYKLSGLEEDHSRLVSCFRDGFNAPNSAPSVRVLLAGHAATLLAERSMWQDAATLLDKAVDLLQAVSPRALQQKDKQFMLSTSSGLAIFAAAVTLNAGGGPEDALKPLEVGRVVISGLLLEMRTDVAELKHGHPALAAEFESIRDHLDSPSSETAVSAPEAQLLSWERQARRRRELEIQFRTTIDRIRDQPGFESFLLPPKAEQIRAAASSGPIVVLNHTMHRSDAFIITSEVIRTIPLDLSALPELLHEVRMTDSFLERLWDSIACPVLNTLGFSESLANMPEHAWPRMWWILTGPLSRLPIHAAGRYLTNPAETVLDRVISSYSTSIKALIYARETSAKKNSQITSHQALLVSMRGTPPHGNLVLSDLQFAEEEIAIVDSILTPSLPRTVMTQPTRDEVLHSVETCTIFHFAGHGISDPQDPSSSCLLLTDWADHPLTVKDLTELKLFAKSPWLAYLSACSTGESKAKGLHDEALHLVSSCQLAGFPHVIGSLWKIDDECSADAARHVYETMQSGGWTDRAVALGVHHAARFLRRKT
ncbi:TPR domain-containing protein, partial [Colletotrichum musicola]